jgi:hypothetical protein
MAAVEPRIASSGLTGSLQSGTPAVRRMSSSARMPNALGHRAQHIRAGVMPTTLELAEVRIGTSATLAGSRWDIWSRACSASMNSAGALLRNFGPVGLAELHTCERA